MDSFIFLFLSAFAQDITSRLRRWIMLNLKPLAGVVIEACGKGGDTELMGFAGETFMLGII
tara:strand:+ start:1528 stop:1710 length:183 start_codon:yes stop_codon:yes gene_type:complete